MPSCQRNPKCLLGSIRKCDPSSGYFFYMRNDEELQHKSSVIVSDCLIHNASTVIAFLKQVIVPKVKEIFPDASFVHYWSDSPTSQYRNKTIFSIINRHKQMFGISASWNYFEAGYGKGPCERMADQATNEISRFNLQIISLLGQVQRKP